MKLDYLMTFDSDVKEIQNVGTTPYGTRYIYQVTGGQFEGPRLSGYVKDGVSADWMMIVNDGLSKIDVRKTFVTHDDALIYVTYQGLYQFNESLSERLRKGLGYDYGETLFQVQMQFETGHEKYQWLNRTMAVAEARETGNKVEYRAFALL
ncbi:DUF3237 domain-containing protein [Temperatibacter marinus]|uniref:UPF0311 protein QGN29_05735 n=1 Tax=Temperatibacter marinus TaxID=1456591 RepID=A0AA52EFK4_9PROT|nr:DUF3237 domain-containing protein [Temperatibacter marinus]WND03871.1 DUF3237 domain-containing protein [Temperatibacter marinus]